MHEILDHLPPGSRLLDLGSRDGSFPVADYSGLVTVRVDLARPRETSGVFVQADAACLPFRSRTFDAAILNHCLEHFTRLKPALQEVGRVVKRQGAVFVAVPDATTLADRIYRAVYRNAGGHVNFFDSPTALATMLSGYFGMPHAATRTLCCAFNYLNRANIRDSALRRQLRFRGLPERLLAVGTGALRVIDRRFCSRTTVYGWALYFGALGEPVDPTVRTNVCIRCGQAHPSEWLLALGLVRIKWKLLHLYRCPACGAPNVYTEDAAFTHLR